jgi:putative transposase
MKDLKIAGISRRRRVNTTRANPHDEPARNLLARQFTAEKPGDKWVGDITYIRTSSGWCYLAVIIDLYSRRVVGWTVDKEMTAEFAVRALENALKSTGSSPKLHHSDRGSQYTSAGYQQLLKEHKIKCSMSRKGNCYDNAVAESFFATIKRECIEAFSFQSLEEVRLRVFEYIEVFYNRKRIHSSIRYLSPCEFEQQFNQTMAA